MIRPRMDRPIAFDVDTSRFTAAWCTSPHGLGAGIWQAGAGPAADENGDVYIMTGNYGVEAGGGTAPPAAGDLPESFIKLHYSTPADAHSQGALHAVAWFTPFRDAERTKTFQDDFTDYDLGSGGPIVIPGTNLVLGAGKDGVLYVLDRDTAQFGQGSNYAVLKQRPAIFFTYFPGAVDAEHIPNLNNLFGGKTYHLHGSPASGAIRSGPCCSSGAKTNAFAPGRWTRMRPRIRSFNSSQRARKSHPPLLLEKVGCLAGCWLCQLTARSRNRHRMGLGSDFT